MEGSSNSPILMIPFSAFGSILIALQNTVNDDTYVYTGQYGGRSHQALTWRGNITSNLDLGGNIKSSLGLDIVQSQELRV